MAKKIPDESLFLPYYIKQNIAIKDHSFYKTGGIAKYFATPNSLQEIQGSIDFAKKNDLPLLLIGCGSNTVFSDEYFNGVLLSLENLRSWYWETDTHLYAEAGVTNTEIAMAAFEAHKQDAYWLTHMPGQLGATVRMNGRCYGKEMANIVTHVVCLNTNGELCLFKGEQFFKGYKDTLAINTPLIVIGARLKLKSPGEREKIAELMNTCHMDRASKHHFDFPSCGSTFKNNYEIGLPSGKIFDDLNLKGTTHGGAMISLHHANFIQNQDNASGVDILELAAFMRNKALSEKGYMLNLEVEALGYFKQDLLTRCGYEISNPSSDSMVLRGNLLAHTHSTHAPSLPKTVFEGLFTEFWKKPGMGIDATVRIEQLLPLTEAAKQPSVPFLRWTTQTEEMPENLFSLMPPAKEGTFIDKLWQFSVSELFLAHPNSSEYIELEITAQQHWIALAFTAPRQRKKADPNQADWLGITTFREHHSFGMLISYAQIQHLLQDNSIKIQCCASLGQERYYLAPHWKNEILDKNQTWDHQKTPTNHADFHLPAKFFPLNLWL